MYVEGGVGNSSQKKSFGMVGLDRAHFVILGSRLSFFKFAVQPESVLAARSVAAALGPPRSRSSKRGSLLRPAVGLPDGGACGRPESAARQGGSTAHSSGTD